MINKYGNPEVEIANAFVKKGKLVMKKNSEVELQIKSFVIDEIFKEIMSFYSDYDNKEYLTSNLYYISKFINELQRVLDGGEMFFSGEIDGEYLEYYLNGVNIVDLEK